MVGAFDDQQNFNRAAALGVANYGQMTAGGWMYIGPQGIVHGTFNTLLNAGRLKLGIPGKRQPRRTAVRLGGPRRHVRRTGARPRRLPDRLHPCGGG